MVAGGWSGLPSLDELDLVGVVYELNTLPIRSCQLLSSLDGLRDGHVFAQMLRAAARTAAQREVASQMMRDDMSAPARLHGVLFGARDLLSLPPDLAQHVTAPAFAAALHQGDRPLLAAIARALSAAVCESSGSSLTEDATADVACGSLTSASPLASQSADAYGELQRSEAPAWPPAVAWPLPSRVENPSSSEDSPHDYLLASAPTQWTHAAASPLPRAAPPAPLLSIKPQQANAAHGPPPVAASVRISASTTHAARVVGRSGSSGGTAVESASSRPTAWADTAPRRGWSPGRPGRACKSSAVGASGAPVESGSKRRGPSAAAASRAALMDMLEKAFPSRRLAPPPPSAAGAPSAGAPSGAPAGAWGALAAAAASGGVRERVSWRFGMPLPEMMTSLQFWDEPSHQQAQQGGGARPAADELPSIDQLASEASVAELITMAAGLSGEAASRALAVPRGEIIRWMHALALPFALLSTDDEVGAATARTRPKWLAARKRRAQSAPARRRTPFDHIVRPADVPPSFASGALLCVLVERLKGPFTALEAPYALSAHQPRTARDHRSRRGTHVDRRCDHCWPQKDQAR